MRKSNKNPEGRWCIFRSNAELKAIISSYIESSGLPVYRFAKGAGIPPSGLHKWLHDWKGYGLTQFQLLKLCEYLRIDVSLTYKFK